MFLLNNFDSRLVCITIPKFSVDLFSFIGVYVLFSHFSFFYLNTAFFFCLFVCLLHCISEN